MIDSQEEALSISVKGSCLTLAAVLMVTTHCALSQQYPLKPIRIVTSEPGGGNDLATRIISQEITAPLGQPFVIDNRAGPQVAAETVARAPADGYTLLITGDPLWLLPFLQDNVSFEALRDFAPITLAVRSPNVLVVHPSLPAKSVKELIALAKAKPGQLNYGSSIPGSSNHLGAELFKTMAGVDIVRVAYKGTAQTVNALLGGEVQVMFSTSGTVVPHVKSGRLRALAIASPQPSKLLSDVPTIAETLPGYASGSIVGVFAPSRTPSTVIVRLNQEIVRALNTPKVLERFFSNGSDVVGSSPEDFVATIKNESARMGKVIRDARIRVE